MRSDRRGYVALDGDAAELPPLPSYSGALHQPGRDVGFSEPPLTHSVHNPAAQSESRSNSANQRDGADVLLESRQFSVESPGKRWDHIKDLDVFFSRIYEYYIRCGFKAMALEEVLNLVQIVFIVFISTFFVQCVNYDILFRKKLPPGNHTGNATDKLTFKDVIVPHCGSHLSPLVLLILLVAIGYIIVKAVRSCYVLIHAWEIGQFYSTAMHVDAARLVNLTWNEVLQCLIQAQRELHLCIQKRDLTELDIYQRILRHKNYTTALVNKELLPPRFRLPLIGDVCYMSHGLALNIDWLLYTGAHSPWLDYWRLRPEFKQRDRLPALADELSQTLLWMALANLALSPFVLLWTLLYIFFSTAELIKRQPGALSMRTWSLTARYFVRHFNELEHELQARLNRGHRPATQYMEQFASNRLLQIGAVHTAFYAASVLAILVVLSVWDEDVLQVEHMLTLMTFCGLVVYGCAAFVSDENLVWCPEWLMDVITAQIHYVPDSWKGHAHTERVRGEFGQLFQYKAYYLLEELLSPIVTPFVLLFCLRPKSKEIVDFFHQFTVDVSGLGDVCSFAQMDLQKHGDPKWNGDWHNANDLQQPGATRQHRVHSDPVQVDPVEAQAAHGKTEMSLMHFTIRNPQWAPPVEADRFLHGFKQQTQQDVDMIKSGPGPSTTLAENPLASSLTALVGGQQIQATTATPGASLAFGSMVGLGGAEMQAASVYKRGRQTIQLNPVPCISEQAESQANSLLASLHQSGMLAPPAFAAAGAGGATSMLDESAVVDMNVSALYMHKLHQHRLRGANYGAAGGRSSLLARSTRPQQPQQQQPQPQPSQLTTGSGLQDADLWGTADSAHEANEEDEDDDSAPLHFPL